MSFQEWNDKLKGTGNIEPVKIGMSRSELLNLFGKPHDFGAFHTEKEIYQILKYGDIEFHFDVMNEDKLWLIYSEDNSGNVKRSIKEKSEHNKG